MTSMTFRVSEVEAFRQWQRDEDYDLELLLARLRGETEPSEAMQAGTAFHKALELAPTGIEATSIAAEGYTFTFAGDFELALPNVREVRASKSYRTPDGVVCVSGQLDTIEGNRVEDHKTTSRFDPDRYLDGYQWRLYLDIFGANHFRWNIFEIAPTDDPKLWEVHNFHRLEQYRYPGMASDCGDLVASLAAFARQHLPERIRAMEAA